LPWAHWTNGRRTGVKKPRDAGDGRSPEFQRFEATVKKILGVSKSELQERMDEWDAHKPHRRLSKSIAVRTKR